MTKAGKTVLFGLLLAILLAPVATVAVAAADDTLTVTYYYMPG